MTRIIKILLCKVNKEIDQTDKIVKRSKKQHQRPKAVNVVWASQEYNSKSKNDANPTAQIKSEIPFRSIRKNRSKGSSGGEEDQDELRLNTGLIIKLINNHRWKCNTFTYSYNKNEERSLLRWWASISGTNKLNDRI